MSSISKVVLVTGCSKGGIGFQLCEEFASRGCKVYATARRPDAMKGLTTGIEQLPLDVTDDMSVEAAVKTILEREGRIDIAVNNAGVICHYPLLDVSMVDVKSTFDTNTYSVLRISKAVVPHMAERRSGTIVNIGSVVGEITTPWSGVYAASKAAEQSISDTLWMECRPFNVSIMHVSAGGVISNLAQNMISRFTLPSGSLYTPWLNAIVERIHRNQRSESLPTEVFAERVVSAALAKNPPRYMTLGYPAGLWWLFSWLPRGWVLRLLWYVLAEKPKAKGK